jgi:methionine biosynthesis protein MetW
MLIATPPTGPSRRAALPFMETATPVLPVAAPVADDSRASIKHETDVQVLSEWITPGSRVLDLGCGRGRLLEHLQHARNAQVTGVDNSLEKIIACVGRGVPAYQGDILDVLGFFPENSFDWVVCSRTVQDLEQPWAVLERALVIGRRVAVGFVNHGFWLNRCSMLRHGHRVRNEVYPTPWYKSRPSNPVAIGEFEEFCAAAHARVTRRTFLAGDWRTPCRFWPTLLAGYALYEITRAG